MANKPKPTKLKLVEGNRGQDRFPRTSPSPLRHGTWSRLTGCCKRAHGSGGSWLPCWPS